jgi:hypothetical protein
MDLDHGVMAPMWRSTSPAQARRRGATGNAPVRPRGAHYGTPHTKARPCRRHSRNVTAHSKENGGGGSRFFCKSFLDKPSTPILQRSLPQFAPNQALCAKNFVTVQSSRHKLCDARVGEILLRAGSPPPGQLLIADRRARLMMKDLLHAPACPPASSQRTAQKSGSAGRNRRHTKPTQRPRRL